MNSVQNLRKLNFASLELKYKLEIKALGRPLPPIKIENFRKANDRSSLRKFNPDVYKRNEWICGCNITNRLFCFPCLLFAGDSPEHSWTKTGVDDLSHLSSKIKRHDGSKTHLNSQLEFHLLGTQGTLHLSDAYRQSIQQKNDQVRKNRYTLSKIIDSVKYCGAFERVLRGHDQPSDSSNFRGVVNFEVELDIALRDHLASSTAFNDTSKEIQSDLLDCMLEVYKEKVKHEMSNADFVSVIVSEITDVAAVPQLAIVFRYDLTCGNPVERFWAFHNPSEHDAKSLAALLTQTLSAIVTSPDKVISQSYDGSSRHSGTQSLLKEQFKYAHHVHCYAHTLNSILSQATSQNTLVRIFFSDLSEIPIFFSSSTQGTAVFNEIVAKKFPHLSNVQFDFKSQTVQVVYENLDSLIECLERIENTSQVNSCIAQARGLRLKLEQPIFEFWLSLFYNIMPRLKTLWEQQQKCNEEPQTLNKYVEDFELAMQSIRNKTVDKLWEEHGQMLQQPKRRKTSTDTTSVQTAAREVCDIVIAHVKERFQFTGHLQAANLLLPQYFQEYRFRFPHTHIYHAGEAYPFLDKQKLKTELEIVYERRDFRCVAGSVPLLQFMIEHNLQNTFSETFKLLKVVTTTPMTTPEAERCFPTLKKVKTFLRKTTMEERLTALAVLSIGRDFINNMEQFNGPVINKFAALEKRRTDFTYKHVNEGDLDLSDSGAPSVDGNEASDGAGPAEANDDGSSFSRDDFETCDLSDVKVKVEHTDDFCSEPETKRQRVGHYQEESKMEEALTILRDLKHSYSSSQGPNDRFTLYGQHVASKLRSYGEKTSAIVEHAINNILFEADMGNYDGIHTALPSHDDSAQ